MKAIRLHQRGGADQIVFEDAPTPEPAHGEVVIQVHAAAITPTELLWNETYRHPDGTPRLPTIPGHDVSGIVAALGPGVMTPAVGDAVYGLIDFSFDGSAAEFVVAPADTLARKPTSLDHVTAAAVPLSALSAWQALFDHGRLEKGGKVLIHGGAGGVGAYAVQLAKWKGAEVFATCSGHNAPFVAQLGADHVINYQTTPFETVAHDIDVVLDTLGKLERERSWPVLRPGGRLIALTAPIDKAGPPRHDVEARFFIVRPHREQLEHIATLLDARKLRVFTEAVFPLSQGRQAFERGATGHLRGKIVLRVVEDPPAR